MDKRALAQKIKTLDGLSNDEKSALLELLHERKKYGIVWEDKPEDVERQLASELPVLTEVKERAIVSDDADAPNHILIEGDNLHALTALSYTHAGKIDVIYIDPPYNTGKKDDFKYNDHWVDKEDSYRHSKWLSFMSKRLEIAKDLLSDKGAIFISIDEHELAQLKMLCDEIFGEGNFVGQWNWFKSETPPALSYKIKRNIEYILGYEKCRNPTKYRGTKKISPSDDPMTKPQNTIKSLTFPPFSINVKLSDGKVPSGTYGTAKFPNVLLNDMIIENGKNTNEVTFQNRFIWLQKTLDEEISKNTRFNCSSKLVLSYKRMEYDPEVPPNYIDNSVNVTTTEEAGKELANIIPDSQFDYPKPISLLLYILNFKDNQIILDFFAGSGTTLHATMQLNAEDGGHRQCILVTNNENNICEEVTYVRNQRVIQGYTTPKGEVVEGLHSNNLRYYKTDFVSRKPSLKNRRMLMSVSTDLLCIKNDVYHEQSLFCGKKWKTACLRFFANERTQMLIIYDEQTIPFVVSALKNEKLESVIRIYVFSNSRYAFEDDFWEVLDKVELCALPAAIYDAYQKVLPPLPPEFLDEEVENHD